MELKNKVKIGLIVQTPHGLGKVCNKEEFRTTTRWGVILHNNPFSWTPAMYFEKEITVITQEQIDI